MYGRCAHRLGEHAALAEADVAGRRADEPGDGVLLLELAHVDGDHHALAAEEQIGEARAPSPSCRRRRGRRGGRRRAACCGLLEAGARGAELVARWLASLPSWPRMRLCSDPPARGSPRRRPAPSCRRGCRSRRRRWRRPLARRRRVDEGHLALDGLERSSAAARASVRSPSLALGASGASCGCVDAVDDRLLGSAARSRAPRAASLSCVCSLERRRSSPPRRSRCPPRSLS